MIDKEQLQIAVNRILDVVSYSPEGVTSSEFTSDVKFLCGAVEELLNSSEEPKEIDWEEFGARHDIIFERHRVTGKPLMFEGLPLTFGILEIYAQSDSVRNGTTFGEEMEKLQTAWENQQ